MTKTLETFECAHCHKSTQKNPRLKSYQNYCGAKACQQARKNKWERDKYSCESCYKSNRRESKRQWYKTSPGYEYQREYRRLHTQYQDINRQKQKARNEKASVLKRAEKKIVKTDALNFERLTSGRLYLLLPYSSETIVKTDAFFVEVVGKCSFTGVLGGNCKDRHDCLLQTEALSLNEKIQDKKCNIINSP